jgi:hypothetical protein
LVQTESKTDTETPVGEVQAIRPASMSPLSAATRSPEVGLANGKAQSNRSTRMSANARVSRLPFWIERVLPPSVRPLTCRTACAMVRTEVSSRFRDERIRSAAAAKSAVMLAASPAG